VPRRANRLTIVVVPPTDRRWFSFQLSPSWVWAALGFAALVVVGLSAAVWYFHGEVTRLQDQVAEVERLRQQARLQQAEIDQLKRAAAQVDEQLAEIRQLERELDAMTTDEEAILPSRSGARNSGTSMYAARGGPETRQTDSGVGLTLSTVLPSDVSPYVLGPRNTLALDLKLNRPPQPAETVLATARNTRATLQAQLAALRNSARSLRDGQERLAEWLDYLAHRPSGWPVQGAEITDRFGMRWSPFGYGLQFHDGIDLGQDYGAPVTATGAGTVVYVGWLEGGYGNTVIIDHGYGFRTLYAHLDDWNVEWGEEVSRGDLIGWVGSTGLSTGPHLHYEVLVNGEPTDPLPYME